MEQKSPDATHHKDVLEDEHKTPHDDGTAPLGVSTADDKQKDDEMKRPPEDRSPLT